MRPDSRSNSFNKTTDREPIKQSGHSVCDIDSTHSMRQRFLAIVLFAISGITVQNPVMANSIPEQIPTALVTGLIGLPVYRNAKLLLGQLPPQFPQNLPLPQRAELLASVAQERGQILDVVLDVPDSQNAVAQRYPQQLEANGWKLDRQLSQNPEPDSQHGGFTFFQNQTRLDVSVYPNSNRSGSRVRLKVTFKQNNPDDFFAEIASEIASIQRLEDDLKPLVEGLPQSTIRTLTGVGTDEQSRRSLELTTQLSREELIDRLNRSSLQKWQRRAGGHQGALIWSVWTYRNTEGQHWEGTVQILESSRQQYLVYMTIEKLKADFWNFGLPDDPSNPKTLPRSLALRLINYPENQAELGLFVGKLPPLPESVPLPNLPVIGGTFSPSKNYLIFFDAASQDNILASYETQLRQAGWTASEWGADYDRGFVSNNGFVTRTYCRGESQALSIFQAEATRFNLSLNLEPYEYSPCRVKPPLPPEFAQVEEQFKAIPTVKLLPPQGSLAELRGSGATTPTGFTSEAAIITPLTIAELAQHYETQIAATGWQSIANDGDRQVRQSIWTLDRNGKKWQSILTFTQNEANPNEYRATLSIFSLTEQAEN